MPIFLGIDGGGTKTSCLLGDEHAVLGSGAGAASNLIRVGEAEARESLAAAIRQACAAANVTPAQISKTCVGMAGASRLQISRTIQRILSQLIPGEIQIVGDMVIALEAAFGEGPGVVVVAGTGSIAYGRNPARQTSRAGGWGSVISDEGSGHWIGRAAVSAAMRTHDEGKQPTLLELILKSWAINSQDQLVLAANADPAPNFSKLAPVILSAADAGDTVAIAVLTQAGAELAALAGIVIQRIFSDAASIPVAMAGGIFRNSAVVRQSFCSSIRSGSPQVLLDGTVIEPVRGALGMARAMAGPSSRS